MNDDTFVKYFKKIYPNTYESLVEDFERHYRVEARRKSLLK